MKYIITLIGCLVALIAADDPDFTANLNQQTPKQDTSIRRVTFLLSDGVVQSIEVHAARKTAVEGIGVIGGTINVTFSRAEIVAAGFTNSSGQVLIGSLEAKGGKAFRSWAIEAVNRKAAELGQ